MKQGRSSPTQEYVRRQIAELGPWFHNIELSGIPTAPDHFLGDYPSFKWARFSHVVPEDLSGWSVLDIGCNGGFYAIEMKRRGADKVVAVDSDSRYLKQAAFAAEQCGVDIEFEQISVYEIGKLGRKFDLVIFMGVLYHLRHPLLALDLIREHVMGEKLLFQCLQRGSDSLPELASDYPFSEWAVFEEPAYPRLFFVEHCYSGDPTNWFIPNRAAVEAMLRSAGFAIEAHPEREVYLCGKSEQAFPPDASPF